MRVGVFMLTAIAVSSIYAIPAAAQSEDILSGNHWYQACISKDEFDVARCLSFVIGIEEGMEVQRSALDGDKIYCAPKGVTYGQKVAMFIKMLTEKPEARHERAVVLFTLMMRQHFPCK